MLRQMPSVRSPGYALPLPQAKTWHRAIGCHWPLVVAVALLLTGVQRSVADPSPADGRGASQSTDAPRPPRIAPDYAEVVIPPNLAPLNFRILEPGAEYRLRLTGPHGQPMELQSAQPGIRLPLEAWKELLGANRGNSLRWSISVRNAAGDWVEYAPFRTAVAAEGIDPYLFYRRFQPLYSTYKHMGIYQRHLETFEERPILLNEKIEHGCVNCHTPHAGSTDRFALSFRGRFGTPTLLIESNQLTRVDAKMGYLAWHPNGKLLAFATNTITQFFHLAGAVNRDTYDARSGINLYHLGTRQIETPAALDAPDRNENWPAWSADGRWLYYASGPRLEFRDIATLRCDLFRAAYDPATGAWGSPELLVSSAEHRFSAHEPRPSPDGRYLVFTVSDSGSFPLFHPESDLFLMRLDTRELERLPINSNHADTYHSWSSNGRWLVFASRGLDGVFARLMLTYFDTKARFSKPLLLPQEDPAYYETCLHNFNVPELGRGPVRVSEAEMVQALNRGGMTPAPAVGIDPDPPYARE